MDFITFNRLSDKGKCFHLKNNGTYMATRKEAGCWINLYTVNGYFTEVWFQLSDNKIVFVNTFDNKDILEKYIENIDITDLVEA